MTPEEKKAYYKQWWEENKDRRNADRRAAKVWLHRPRWRPKPKSVPFKVEVTPEEQTKADYIRKERARLLGLPY